MSDSIEHVKAREMVEFKLLGATWQVCLVENPDETFQAIIHSIPPDDKLPEVDFVKECANGAEGRRFWLIGVLKTYQQVTEIAKDLSRIGPDIAVDIVSYGDPFEQVLQEAQALK